jgi:hypothetical protein
MYPFHDTQKGLPAAHNASVHVSESYSFFEHQTAKKIMFAALDGVIKTKGVV